MAAGPTYLNAHADEERERRRLRHLEAWQDPATVRHLRATGLREGWRCLEVGAGRGAIARWLGDEAGATGSVVALDIDPKYLGDLPDTVEVRRHDLLRDDLEREAFDLVHCRALLMHVPDVATALARMADAVAPGGWLVVEEGDFGLLDLTGSPGAAGATRTWHEMWSGEPARAVTDAFFGRRVPGLVHALGWEDLDADSTTVVAHPGEPAFEALRLAWPEYQRARPLVRRRRDGPGRARRGLPGAEHPDGVHDDGGRLGPQAAPGVTEPLPR
jgi:SAM-dependent methyltransferase